MYKTNNFDTNFVVIPIIYRIRNSDNDFIEHETRLDVTIAPSNTPTTTDQERENHHLYANNDDSMFKDYKYVKVQNFEQIHDNEDQSSSSYQYIPINNSNESYKSRRPKLVPYNPPVVQYPDNVYSTKTYVGKNYFKPSRNEKLVSHRSTQTSKKDFKKSVLKHFNDEKPYEAIQVNINTYSNLDERRKSINDVNINKKSSMSEPNLRFYRAIDSDDENELVIDSTKRQQQQKSNILPPLFHKRVDHRHKVVHIADTEDDEDMEEYNNHKYRLPKIRLGKPRLPVILKNDYGNAKNPFMYN